MRISDYLLKFLFFGTFFPLPKRKKCAIIAFVLLLLLTACQPTPEVEIIPNKGDDPLQAVIADSGEGPDLAVYGAGLPARWVENMELGNGAVTAAVDAKITFPETDRLPIVQIAPAGIDLNAVEILVQALAPGGYLASIPVDEFGMAVWTKERIEAEMEQNNYLADNAGKLHPEYSERELKTYRQTLEDANRELMAAYQTASDEAPVPIDNLFSLRDGSFQGDVGLFDGSGRRLAEMMLVFDGTGRQREQLHLRTMQGGIGKRVASTQEEALTWAADLIRAMGYEGRYSLLKAQESAASITLTFGPLVHGVDYAPGCEPETEFVWAAFAPEESLEMIFDREPGALAVLSWVGRSEVVREVSENAALLPMERVQELIRNDLTFLLSWANENVRSRAVHIQELRLGYKRIRTPNEQGWLLVPVWTVEGSVTDSGFSTDMDTGTVDAFTNKVMEGPLLILNAADGTLIGTATLD